MWREGPIPRELANFPGYLMARLGQASSRAMQERLEPLDLHPRHFGVMNIVARRPGVTQQTLHEDTAIDTSSMVALIDELEQRGLAERRPHPADRRARAIHLTEAGEAKLEQARQIAAELQREFFAALTATEQRELLRLLQKVAEGRLGSGTPKDPPA